MTPDPLLKYSLSQIQKPVLTHNQNKLASGNLSQDLKPSGVMAPSTEGEKKH